MTALRSLTCILTTALLGALSGPFTGPATARERLELHTSSVELPGAPASILAADIDGDGRQDLVVAVAYTEWDQVSIEEQTTMDDVEGLVEVMTIVPALFDRRELHVFRAVDGGYERLAPALELERSVQSLTTGTGVVLALTDDGVSVLRFRDGELLLDPLFEERTLLAGTGSFIGRLDFVHDLNGDGELDVLVPTRRGATVVPLRNGRVVGTAVPLSYPIDPAKGLQRHHPWAEAREVTGDANVDLVLPHHRERWRHFHVLTGQGAGRFAEPIAPLGPPPPPPTRVLTWEDYQDGDDNEESDATVIHFGDLDGDGQGEFVTAESLAAGEGGLRKGMREAKRPPFRYTFHRVLQENGTLAMADEPYQTLDALGYAFAEAEDDEGRSFFPGGFQDLNGDGRPDLITLTLDFSLFQAVRILTVKSINIGLDFHVFCQRDDGSFREVRGLDLSGKFRLNLRDLRLGQLSFFDADFDGDGRADFVQLGRGRQVTIHRGRENCSYPSEPDLVVRMSEEPRNVALVRIDDFDGDNLTDLIVVQPQKTDDPDVTAPVRLDIYRSLR